MVLVVLVVAVYVVVKVVAKPLLRLLGRQPPPGPPKPPSGPPKAPPELRCDLLRCDLGSPEDHLRKIFNRMGFDDKGIVALSGAHTIGRAGLIIIGQ